jgi:hypothetical protein
MKSLKLLLVLMLAVPLLTNAADRLAYILNSTGETLSKINLTTGVVDNDIVTIGSDIYSYPNQIVVRDSLAYVIASGTDELQIIDLKRETTVDFINTGVSSNPYWMAFYDSQFVYVTLMLQNKIIKIDVLDGTIVHEMPTGVSPAGIVISDNKAYVVCSGYDFENYTFNPSKLFIYNLNDNSLINQLDVGLNAQYAAVDNLGNIHVVATGNYYDIFGEVYIIDSGLDEIINNFSVGGSPGLINIGPDSVAYIAAAGWSQSGYIFSYNTLTGEMFHDVGNPIEVGLNCLTAIPFQDSTIFAASFSTDYINVIDSTGNRLMDYAVGDGPIHLDFNYLPGDANGDFNVDILDVVYVINWKYKNGPETVTAKWRANVNADMYYNILDIVYLINYLYKDGPVPKVGIPWLL